MARLVQILIRSQVKSLGRCKGSPPLALDRLMRSTSDTVIGLRVLLFLSIFHNLKNCQCLNQLVFSGADFGHPQAQEPEGGDASPGRLLGQALSRFSRGADPQMGQQSGPSGST